MPEPVQARRKRLEGRNQTEIETMSTQITPPKAGSAAPAAMLVLTATLLLGPSAGAATTNWVAYNDHARGGGTAANVSVYSIGTSTAVGGPLTNYDTGTLITPNRVGVDIRPVVTPINGVTGDCTAPSSGTHANTAAAHSIDASHARAAPIRPASHHQPGSARMPAAR